MAGFHANGVSNLDKLLKSMTPIVPLKLIPENCIDAVNKVWDTVENPITEYYTLRDLWKTFEKCSAYGLETPVILNDGEDVRQYFTPYLSAIEIYTNKSAELISRSCRNVSNGTNEYGSDTGYLSSDRAGAINKVTRSGSNSSGNNSTNTFSRAWDDDSEDSSTDLDSLTKRNSRDNRYMSFHDASSPYGRVPLADKVKQLAKEYPGLTMLRSIDLSPASWFAVAWYPIYKIPSKGPVKDLSAAFLTFHTLSSYYRDGIVDVPDRIPVRNTRGSNVVLRRKMSLPPFGLATYMLVGDVWLNHGYSDYGKLCDLHQAACAWVNELNFFHHDFNFFSTRSGVQYQMT